MSWTINSRCLQLSVAMHSLEDLDDVILFIFTWRCLPYLHPHQSDQFQDVLMEGMVKCICWAMLLTELLDVASDVGWVIRMTTKMNARIGRLSSGTCQMPKLNQPGIGCDSPIRSVMPASCWRRLQSILLCSFDVNGKLLILDGWFGCWCA